MNIYLLIFHLFQNLARNVQEIIFPGFILNLINDLDGSKWNVNDVDL